MHSIRHMKTIEFKTFDTSEDNIRTSSAFNYLNSNTENKSYNDLDQYVMIENLCTNTDFETKDLLIRDIKTKLSSYSQQDKLKQHYDKDVFIKLDEVIRLLYDASMSCYYCSQKIKVIYEYKRTPEQWTLDRIDNDLGHTKENVVICCLSCNLRRRCLNSDKYLFTKTLKINKIK